MWSREWHNLLPQTLVIFLFNFWPLKLSRIISFSQFSFLISLLGDILLVKERGLHLTLPVLKYIDWLCGALNGVWMWNDKCPNIWNQESICKIQAQMQSEHWAHTSWFLQQLPFNSNFSCKFFLPMQINGTVGYNMLKSMIEYTEEEIQTGMSANFESAFHTCQLACPLLKASGNGSIVNVSSLSGTVACWPGALYGGMQGMVEVIIITCSDVFVPSCMYLHLETNGFSMDFLIEWTMVYEFHPLQKKIPQQISSTRNGIPTKWVCSISW